MNSTTAPKAAEPDDALAARADERLVHAYAEIARADEQLARLNEQLSRLEHDGAHHPSAVVGNPPRRGRPARRGVIGLLLAVCIFVGAFVSQSSYGDAARSMVARWAPQLTSSLWMEKPGDPAQPNPSTVQLAAATPGLPQPPPSAQTAVQDVAPTAAPPSAVEPLTGLKQIARRAARDAERLAIADMLERTRWNRTKAARMLQISYKALLYKIVECGLVEKPVKEPAA